MENGLRERQKSILEAVIQEYIRMARPVASQELVRARRFGISPATIRNEMLELDEKGYLEQPHTSAGRIPTDKGYRFFVDHLLARFHLSEQEEHLLEELFRLDAAEEFVKEFGRVAARISGMFTAVGAPEDGLFYDTGFSEVLDEPEFQDPDAIRDFGRFTDFLEDQVRAVAAGLGEEDREQIFIGRENPWKEAQSYTTVIAAWHHPRGFRGFITLIGPRRTNYSKHIALIQQIKREARPW